MNLFVRCKTAFVIALILTTASAFAQQAVTTTTGGTRGNIPLFTGTANIENSNLFDNATGLGIGRNPSQMLDVNGNSVFRGFMQVSRTNDATPTTSSNSYPIQFNLQVYNTVNKIALNPFFTFQAEGTGNNTANTGATLNLTYYNGIGPAKGAETGLYFNPNGVIHFAAAQTFPITTGATGPAGPQGPTGPTGPAGPQGPAGPTGSVPANLTALSGQLSTTNGVAYLGSDRFQFPGACVIGDVFLSVNGYGSGNALPADGRLIPIQNNTALFSLIGTNFGGNGTSNYALPDLRAFAPKGVQYSICLYGTFPSIS